ncbi:MAG: hypothetical protein EXR64_01710 [Dehalococcoidia bacterium]|nr:hypothetical protein [Dehalococcoidia bacterium]
MSSRQAIEAALAAADARLDALKARMETYADDKLLDDGGKWSVRDCLCHVAGSSKVSAAGTRALARLNPPAAPAAAPAGAAPAMSVDERNQAAIAERAGKSIADLIAEAKAGHAASLVDLKGWDDATLEKKVPDMQPNRPAQSVGGNILRSLEYHEGGQMDRIEGAINVRTRWT